jgi:alkylhydroperoxidase family enzyme
MPRVPVHTIGDAPERSREALRGLERRMGRLLNIHAEMAHAPVVLAAYQGIQKAIARHGSFDAKTREAIALTVGAVDKCAYCQSARCGRASRRLVA